MTPVRVLLVAPAPPPYGGMAIQARQLEQLLRTDGNRVGFFPSNFPCPLGLGRFPFVRTVARFLAIWPMLWRRMAGVDVVHILAASWFYFFGVVYPAVLVAALRGRRIVVNYRGGEAGEFFRRYGWLAWPVFRIAHCITTPSEFLAGIIRGRFGVEVSIVPNILNTSRFVFQRRAEFAPKLLVCRHLEEIYDIESVLKAFARVQQQFAGASLWIAGAGSQEAKLRTLAAEWKLCNLRFLGPIPHADLPAIYNQCDILLNASKVDNFPGALLEAAAAGLVIVSTNPGGIPFIFQNGETAVLVNVGNWEALAAGVVKIVDDPAAGARLTENARRLALSCEWRHVRLALYRSYGLAQGDGSPVALESTG